MLERRELYHKTPQGAISLKAGTQLAVSLKAKSEKVVNCQKCECFRFWLVIYTAYAAPVHHNSLAFTESLELVLERAREWRWRLFTVKSENVRKLRRGDFPHARSR